ncbi:5-methyltetrahydropteroyltriglutamate--homocysteine methyltransferase 1-like, partial [Olea europaea subsp. europaea]
MCYSNFNVAIRSIINIDTNVVTVENSKSVKKLCSIFCEIVRHWFQLVWCTIFVVF